MNTLTKLLSTGGAALLLAAAIPQNSDAWHRFRPVSNYEAARYLRAPVIHRDFDAIYCPSSPVIGRRIIFPRQHGNYLSIQYNGYSRPLNYPLQDGYFGRRVIEEQEVRQHQGFELEVPYSRNSVPTDNQVDNVVIDFMNGVFRASGNGHMAYDLKANRVVVIRDNENRVVHRFDLDNFWGKQTFRIINEAKAELIRSGAADETDLANVAIVYRNYEAP